MGFVDVERERRDSDKDFMDSFGKKRKRKILDISKV